MHVLLYMCALCMLPSPSAFLYVGATYIDIDIPYNGKIWRVLYLANGPFERIGVF